MTVATAAVAAAGSNKGEEPVFAGVQRITGLVGKRFGGRFFGRHRGR
jgi:hypothetical protein